jgi:hypothetical protein
MTMTTMMTRSTLLRVAVVITMLAFASPRTSAADTPFAGCPGTGVAFPVDYWLPDLWGNYVVVSDERRNGEQLAATFPDPADALSRLGAWCWQAQAERVYLYTRDQMTVDVSIHDFVESAGALLAQRWFAFQRKTDLGLLGGGQSVHLEEELAAGGLGGVNIEALDGLVIQAYVNDTEYTLYARRGTDRPTQTRVPDDILVRVTVSGGSQGGGRTRQAVAYQVLAEIFGVDLFTSHE